MSKVLAVTVAGSLRLLAALSGTCTLSSGVVTLSPVGGGGVVAEAPFVEDAFAEDGAVNASVTAFGGIVN